MAGCVCEHPRPLCCTRQAYLQCCTCLGVKISVELPRQRIQGVWKQESERKATAHVPARTSS